MDRCTVTDGVILTVCVGCCVVAAGLFGGLTVTDASMSCPLHVILTSVLQNSLNYEIGICCCGNDGFRL